MDWILVHLMLHSQYNSKVILMGIHMISFRVCCLVLDLNQQMYQSLIPMKALEQAFLIGKYFVQRLELLKEQHLVHMMVQSQDHQKDSMIERQMESLMVCCWEPEFYQYMDLIQEHTKLLNQASRMGNLPDRTLKAIPNWCI